MHGRFVKKFLFSALLTGLFLGVLFLGGYAVKEQASIAGSVLRLHIIGNTNTDIDQALKLLVRDSILKEHRNLFANATSAQDAAIKASLAAFSIADTAEKTLQQHGCLAPVTVRVEETSFPTKEYGNVRLPAGTYTAVNVRLGSSTGKNWWCVLYPPLCLTEGSLKADDETLAMLQKELSPNEYAMITQPEKITFRMKFRILELLGEIFG